MKPYITESCLQTIFHSAIGCATLLWRISSFGNKSLSLYEPLIKALSLESIGIKFFFKHIEHIYRTLVIKPGFRILHL